MQFQISHIVLPSKLRVSAGVLAKLWLEREKPEETEEIERLKREQREREKDSVAGHNGSKDEARQPRSKEVP